MVSGQSAEEEFLKVGAGQEEDGVGIQINWQQLTDPDLQTPSVTEDDYQRSLGDSILEAMESQHQTEATPFSSTKSTRVSELASVPTIYTDHTHNYTDHIHNYTDHTHNYTDHAHFVYYQNLCVIAFSRIAMLGK